MAGTDHDDTTTDGDAPADTFDAPHPAVQEQLPLDEPVPFRLTSQGRRTVAPDDLPRLRVVPVQRVRHVDLDEVDGAVRARARALRLAGSHTLDIADELEVDPLHVEAWVADLPVPADAGRARRARQLRAVPGPVEADPPSRAAIAAAWREALDDGRTEAEQRLAGTPSLVGGLGMVIGLLELDQHALLLATDQLPLLRAAWSWIEATLGPVAGARVLVQHDPTAPGDRTAREVATALGLPLDAVTATREASRSGRPPWVRLRVSDVALAGRVAGWRRALLAEVEQGAG